MWHLVLNAFYRESYTYVIKFEKFLDARNRDSRGSELLSFTFTYISMNLFFKKITDLNNTYKYHIIALPKISTKLYCVKKVFWSLGD